jgi:hypothetical protein
MVSKNFLLQKSSTVTNVKFNTKVNGLFALRRLAHKAPNIKEQAQNNAILRKYCIPSCDY